MSLHRPLTLALLALSAACGPSALEHELESLQQNEVAALPWLKTSGNQIVTESGAPVLLRGANILASEFDNNTGWEKRAFPLLAQTWKGNILVRGFAADPVNANNAQYLAMLDDHVALGAANRVYVMFVFRSYSQNGPQPTVPDQRATSALVKLATRYKGKPGVMFGLQVEPHDVSWATLRPLFESMVDAIQTASAPYKPLIFVPGNDWGRDVSGAIKDPVRRTNIVYKTHPYNVQGDFNRLFVTAYDSGLPVFIGEFGLFGEVCSCTMTDINALLALANAKGLGWAAWIFGDGGPPDLTDRNGNPTAGYGTAVKAEMVKTPPLPSGTEMPVPVDAGTVDAGSLPEQQTDAGTVEPGMMNPPGQPVPSDGGQGKPGAGTPGGGTPAMTAGGCSAAGPAMPAVLTALALVAALRRTRRRS